MSNPNPKYLREDYYFQGYYRWNSPKGLLEKSPFCTTNIEARTSRFKVLPGRSQRDPALFVTKRTSAMPACPSTAYSQFSCLWHSETSGSLLLGWRNPPYLPDIG